MKCRSKVGGDLKEIFTLGDMYVSDFIAENESPRAGEEEMKLMLCEKTGLLQLESAVDPDFMYGKYWYRSGVNTSMTRELEDVVASVIDAVPTESGDIFLDIACNDGTLLKNVQPYTGESGFFRIGVDPCDDTFLNEAKQHADWIIQDYFTKDCYNNSPHNEKWDGKWSGKKAKLITCIAMFYDLDNPRQFLSDVYDVMDDEGLFVLQMSYTPLMLQQLAFDNICHEHVCYYSLSSIKTILEAEGFNVVDCILNDVNGGSFRIYVRKNVATTNLFRTAPYRDVANFRIDSILSHEKSLKLDEPEIYEKFYKDICDLRDQTVEFIKQAKAEGATIWGYGASTKGNTLLQWFGLDHTLIDGIAERNPQKYGMKTVGTNIPIFSEAEMREANPDYLLILPWHFIKEFKDRENLYLEQGGKFIVPCPKFEVISK